MADTLSSAYLQHLEVDRDQKVVLTVSDPRFPTEKGAEEINMFHYLPVRENQLKRKLHSSHLGV